MLWSPVVVVVPDRYERRRDNRISHFVEQLRNNGVEEKFVDIVQKVQRYAGEAKRTSDLYGTKSVLNKLGSQISREFKGVENVYTQHSPVLKATLESVIKGKMKESEFPFLGSSNTTSSHIVVYMVGGFTYEEVCWQQFELPR